MSTPNTNPKGLEGLRELAIRLAWPEVAGYLTYETLPESSRKHIDTFMSAIEALLVGMEGAAERAVTYDSIALGWEGEKHFREILAIQNGKVLKSRRVSDETLRSYFPQHGRVITGQHIQTYGEQHLTGAADKEKQS